MAEVLRDAVALRLSRMPQLREVQGLTSTEWSVFHTAFVLIDSDTAVEPIPSRARIARRLLEEPFPNERALAPTEASDDGYVPGPCMRSHSCVENAYQPHFDGTPTAPAVCMLCGCPPASQTASVAECCPKHGGPQRRLIDRLAAHGVLWWLLASGSAMFALGFILGAWLIG